ncbi:MAG: hypothetical protein KAY11_17875 [Ilumatobacteraceae bacterium]|jgi:hypothetical protein|nr:hypothetical protein [Ilumatobacteraceae bacterium]
MTEKPKSGVAAAVKFFGKLPGQSLAEFAKEWNELSDESKTQLANGINDGSLTY